MDGVLEKPTLEREYEKSTRHMIVALFRAIRILKVCDFFGSSYTMKTWQHCYVINKLISNKLGRVKGIKLYYVYAFTLYLKLLL